MLARSSLRAAVVGAFAVVLSAHVGSPDVFFNGRAGPYDLRVVVRPPEVVPGIARVVVHASAGVRRVSIRPVFWRAGSRGAPSPDAMRHVEGAVDAGIFEGSLWLMARGAYSVDVIVDGSSGAAHVLVPVASVATGRLALSPALGALLAILGVVLVAGLVNIVYKGAGESLVEVGAALDPARVRRAKRVAAVSVPILAAALLGGARWWGAVDQDYQRRMYRPLPIALSRSGDMLELRAGDTSYSASGRALRYVPDHGKLMHLFFVRADDASAFAHLHPHAKDTSAVPAFETRIPPLPAGLYRVYADVVDETGFERTLVAALSIPDSASRNWTPFDADDARFVGEASPGASVRLDDGSTMTLGVAPNALITAREVETLRITVTDPTGRPATLEPYVGMPAHAVIVRVDGQVYVHLHPMGTVSVAAQDAFLARDRGDTAADGRLRIPPAQSMASACHPERREGSAAREVQIPHCVRDDNVVEFPYAFPRSGSYRLFVQVKRNGHVLTGAYALAVADPVAR